MLLWYIYGSSAMLIHKKRADTSEKLIPNHSYLPFDDVVFF